jgi:hypothetical protein
MAPPITNFRVTRFTDFSPIGLLLKAQDFLMS